MKALAWMCGIGAVIGACATAPPPVPVPPVPSKGGPAWIELTSEHFTVWTDSSPQQARALVRTMEHLRQVVLGVSFFQTTPPGRSFVVAFRNVEEVHAYVPPQFIAHAWSARNLLFQPVIVLSASSLDGDRQIVTHELTHVVAFNAIPDQPHWFAEGMAGYFETVRLDESSSKLDVGVPLQYRMQSLHTTGPLPSAALFACDKPACMDERYYATAWALITFLINEHSAELQRYMQRLRETPADQQSALWAETFPSLPQPKLDRELARWLNHGSIRVLKYNAALREPTITERPLVDADALAARGLIRYLFSRTSVPSEVAEALGADGTHLLANIIKAYASKSIDPDHARSIAAAHADDWRAWMLVWMAVRGTADAADARERTCALLAKNPAAVPPAACEEPDPNDPRRAVFVAASPQFTKCLASAGGWKPADGISVEIDISESGAVTAARVKMGSPEASACMEGVIRGLTFPPHRAGTFTIHSAKPAQRD